MPMPLSCTSRTRKSSPDTGPDLDARRSLETARLLELVDRFHPVLEQVDQHLVELGFLNADLFGGVAAVHVRADAPAGKRVLQDPQGAEDGLAQVDVLAGHALAVETPLGTDDVDDVARLAVDAFDRADQLLILPDEVAGESQQKRPHLPALGIVPDIVDPVVRMRLDGLRQGGQAFDQRIVRQLFLQRSNADADAVNGVADVVQDGIHHLQAALGEGLGNGFSGPHSLRHVAEYDHPAASCSTGGCDGPAAGADIDPLRLGRGADENLHLIGRLPAHGAHQGKFLSRHEGDCIGIEDAVLLRESFEDRIDPASDNAFRTLVEGEVAILIGDYDPVADAVENGLHEPDLMLQLVNGFFQFVPDFPMLENITPHDRAGWTQRRPHCPLTLEAG